MYMLQRQLIMRGLLIAMLLSILPPASFAQQPNPILNRYLLPNERVVTLQPGLRYQGRLYEISYFTTGSLVLTKPIVIGIATPEYFTQQKITGILVTVDGAVVDDTAEVREILSLYRAAYHLYERAQSGPYGYTDFYPFDAFRDDLKKVTQSIAFAPQRIAGSFDTQSQRKEEALRAMMTNQQPAPALLKEFDEAVQKGLRAGFDIGTVADQVLTVDKFSNNRNIRIHAAKLRTRFAEWRPVTSKLSYSIGKGNNSIELGNALDIIRLASQLYFMEEFEQDRVRLLQDYQGFFTQGPGSLDTATSDAVTTVIAESNDDLQRRETMVQEFAKDQLITLATRMTTKDLSASWVKISWKLLGKRIRGHRAAGAASKVVLVYSLASILYGLDDIYSNFVVAESADDLRQTFVAGRLDLQAAAKRGGATEFDAELARKFRTAYMLENLAAAQAFRSYADGVDATTVKKNWLSILSPVTWINFARGEDWAKAAQELRDIGTKIERDAEEEVIRPAFLDVAVALILNRLELVRAPLGKCPVGATEGVRRYIQAEGAPNESYVLCVDLNDRYLRFETVMAGDIRSVNPPRDYRETAQSMVQREPYQVHRPIAAFNADYFGAGHGPEGFTVVNGLRIDGAYSADRDNNEIKRVSIGISRVNRISFGLRNTSEVGNALLQRSQFYNATGGGPTLIRDGNLIRDPCVPELFNPEKECRETRQTAIGISEDGKTLILIVGNNQNAEDMGRLLIERGARDAIKLDGGSSSQLWYRGESLMEGNPVANAILLFREEIPRHDAFLLQQSPFPVVQSSEPITFSVTLRNTGFLPWDPKLSYGLKYLRGERFGFAPWQPIMILTGTNRDAAWEFKSTAPAEPGLYDTEWQLVYRDERGVEETIGPPIGFVITVLPEGVSSDIMSSWRQLVDQAQREAQGRLDAFLKSIEDELRRRARDELRKQIPRPLWCLFGLGMIGANGALLSMILRRRKRSVHD
jgi:hypothetical protein